MLKIDTDFTRFDGFEIYPVRQVDELKDGSPVYEQVDELIDGEPKGGCNFWTVYGHFDSTDFNAGVAFANVGIEALIDCHTRVDAERLAVYFTEMRKLQLATQGE